MLQACCLKHSSHGSELQACGQGKMTVGSDFCWNAATNAALPRENGSKLAEHESDEEDIMDVCDTSCIQFRIVLEKTSASNKWGIDIEWRNRTNLKVVKVNDGIVNQWNSRNPSKQIQPGDLIVALNGIAGDVQGLAKEIQLASRLEVLVQREIVPMISSLEEVGLVGPQEQCRPELFGYLEAFQANTSYPEYCIYDINMFETGTMTQSLRNYYNCCTESKELVVTTSCFSVWQKAKKTNGAAKVIPAIPANMFVNGEQVVRMFFFDDNINLHLGGAENADGICNLRSIVSGEFVDFSAGANGFVADQLFRHTTVHHSKTYNAVLVQANILDALVNHEYFSSILDRYSNPGEKLLVYADVNGTLVWDDTVASKSVNEIMLCTMFRFAEVRPKADEPSQLQWESQPAVDLKNEDLRSLIYRISAKNDEYYQKFWTLDSCRKFIDQVGKSADIAWLKQKTTIDPNQFFVDYHKNLDEINRIGISDGIPESWISCYDRLVSDGHSIVLNSFGVDSEKVVKRMSLDLKDVLHLTINRDMWGQRDANLWNKQFLDQACVSGYPN